MDGILVAFLGGAGLAAKQNVHPALRHFRDDLKMIPAHDILKLRQQCLEPAPAGKYAVHIAVEHHNAGGGVVNEKPQFDIGFGQFLGIHLEGVFDELALPVGLTICVADRGQQPAHEPCGSISSPKTRLN